MGDMLLLALLKSHWFDLAQTVGIVSGFVYTARAFSLDSRARRAEFTLSINAAHREVWSALLKSPELARILETDPDLASKPVTQDEERMTLVVLHHLASVHQAIELRLYPSWAGIEEDVRWFFTRPIPKLILERFLPVQAPEFRRFLRRVLRHGKQRSKGLRN